MSPITALRVIVVLIGMLTLPGWAALTLGDRWRQWQGLQRWVVAAGLSIAFYPVFFYGVRFAVPFLTLGPYKMGTLLLAFALLVGWRMRGHWREQFVFDRLEWAAVAVFGMTLFTRFWVIRDHPYPAWSDSLHHTLLTQLTAVQGQLPASMEPYFPVPLEQYHLGLYALSATVQWLAQVPAHTALLWTAQVLNGLCGAGVYVVLYRTGGRVGAGAGAAMVGLLSHQPAFYVNWGRFTQVASQTVLLVAWVVTWEAIALWKRPWRAHRAEILWYTASAAVLTGAVFLLHFCVALFYVPLLMISVVWELWKARMENRVGLVILGAVVIGVATLIVVTPALWEAMRIYITTKLNFMRLKQTPVFASAASQTRSLYYEFSLEAIPSLVARPWLIVLAGFSAMVGLLKRRQLVVTSLLWVFALYLVGKAYLLDLPLLSITNMGAILIMLYLPIGLIVGAAIQEALTLCGPRWQAGVVRLIIGFVLMAGFVASHVRVTEIEPYRHFVTPEDVEAMGWIRGNTPPDALFAVNTYFWLPRAPHGTDAGYWIPYFTDRQVTAGVMLLGLGAADYVDHIIELSQAEEQLEVDNTTLAELWELGVGYIYIGKRGDFSGPGLSVTRLIQAENVEMLYQNAGVAILQIKPPLETN